MICPNCGTGNADGTRFCTGCGALLEGATTPPPPPPTYQQQPPTYQQPPVYQQPTYQQQPAYQQSAPIPAVDPKTMPMSTSEWFWMMLVIAIPLVGFICTLVWAFGSDANINRKNYCRAALIWMLVALGLSIIAGIIIAAAGISVLNYFGAY